MQLLDWKILSTVCICVSPRYLATYETLVQKFKNSVAIKIIWIGQHARGTIHVCDYREICMFRTSIVLCFWSPKLRIGEFIALYNSDSPRRQVFVLCIDGLAIGILNDIVLSIKGHIERDQHSD